MGVGKQRPLFKRVYASTTLRDVGTKSLMYSWSGSGTKKKKKVCIYTCEASESSEAELSTRAFAKERRKKKSKGMSVNHNWMPQPCITSLYTIFLFFSSLYTFSPKRNNQHVAVLCSKRLPCDSGKKKKNRIAFIDFQFYGDRRYDLAIGGRRKGGGVRSKFRKSDITVKGT